MPERNGIVSLELDLLEDRLGYKFKNRELLKAALTHPSYAIEKNLNYNNQRLEFLGDAALDLILAESIFIHYPAADEGVMTKMRSALVCQDALVKLTEKLELGDFMLLGKGERIDGTGARKSVQADGFEAIIGAVYLDGGLDKLRAILQRFYGEVYPEPDKEMREINPKGALQEYSQSRWNDTPSYSVCAVRGPEHRPEYTVEARLNRYVAVGTGNSRKLAETEAARHMLGYLHYLDSK